MKEKPNFRERLIKNGAASLSDLELLQILLGSGNAHISLRQMAKAALRLLEKRGSALKQEELKALSGIGDAKLCIILAAFEISRRLMFCERRKIIYASDMMHLLRNYADRQQEYVICIYLNGANESIAKKIISIGSVNRTIVHPREVFSYAVEWRATSIILAHNHPSGNVLPSPEDELVTERIVDAGRILGITVLDHIIFCRETYYSFSEHKKIELDPIFE